MLVPSACDDPTHVKGKGGTERRGWTAGIYGREGIASRPSLPEAPRLPLDPGPRLRGYRDEPKELHVMVPQDPRA